MSFVLESHACVWPYHFTAASLKNRSWNYDPRLVIGQPCLYTESHGSRSQYVIAY